MKPWTWALTWATCSTCWPTVKVDNIQWSVMPDANASALITLPEDDQFKYVVMPMRI